MGVTVTAPDGRVWVVKRSIVWPKKRDLSIADSLDIPWFDGGGGDLDGIIGTIVLVVAVAILIVVLFPVILLLVESVIVVIGSMFLRRAWIVTAWTPGPPREERQWRVRGFLRTRGAVREVADELKRGVEAEPEHAEV